jgi:hypothetical protein
LRRCESEAKLSKARASLLRDRTNAALTLAAAAAEPPRPWERGRIRLDVAGARVVLHDVETVLSNLIAIDILGHQLGTRTPPGRNSKPPRATSSAASALWAARQPLFLEANAQAAPYNLGLLAL